MNDVEAMCPPYLECKPEGVPQRSRVLHEVAERAFTLSGRVVAVEVDAVDLLVVRLVTFPGRADDGNLVAIGAQRGCLLPYTTVEGRRQVLDEDQDARALD